MLEIKNAVVAIVLILLKHNGLCEIGRFKLFFHRGINTVRNQFSCTRNTVCVHVTCTVIIVHIICEGLDFCWYNLKSTTFAWKYNKVNISSRSIIRWNTFSAIIEQHGGIWCLMLIKYKVPFCDIFCYTLIFSPTIWGWPFWQQLSWVIWQ